MIHQLSHWLGEQFTQLIRQNRHRQLIKLGEKFARHYLQGYENEGYYQMQDNGERYLLQTALLTPYGYHIGRLYPMGLPSSHTIFGKMNISAWGTM